MAQTRKTVTKYMHTLDVRPARFDGRQISFAGRGIVTLRDSIVEIHADQAAFRLFRYRKGWDEHVDYGYVRVRV